MIAIIDYGAGNLRSVCNAITFLGYEVKIAHKPAELADARAIILPGVGAAPDTMNALRNLEFIEPIRKYIAEDRPFFGICIGLQVLFTRTQEGDVKCLNILPGEVKRLPEGLKIPHMGWNQVRQKIKHPIFAGIPDQANFYFVHSYYPEPLDKSLVAGDTDYVTVIPSIIVRGNLLATQFHPEKSGEVGLKMYANFLKMASR